MSQPLARTSIAVLVALLLAGCTDASTESVSPVDEILVDLERPDTTFGDIVTGPAVGPDLNATTAAAPRLVEGEWWRIRFDSYGEGSPPEVVRVVADAAPDGYIFGMPHEGWFKEAISYHAPAFGDVGLDLSYNTHNLRFEPLRFPLVQGATWETTFATSPLIATVESADAHTAVISLTSPPTDPQPTDPATDAVGLTGQDMSMRLTFDARMHEVVRMETPFGNWDVVEHGYGFEGWVTVPRGEDTAIDYGAFLPASNTHTPLPREMGVELGFNRMTLMHAIFPLAPGSYRITTTAPDGTVFETEQTGAEPLFRFYEVSDPGGRWTAEDFVAGVGATYTMGIAYHQYDIRLPDGLRRADHSHAVIR